MPILHLGWIQCAHCPLAAEALLENQCVRISESREAEEDKHRKRDANHHHNDLFRRVKSEQLGSESRRDAGVVVDVFKQEDEHATQKRADKDYLAAGRHHLIKPSPVRLAHEKRNEKANRDDERTQETQEFELALDKSQPAGQNGALDQSSNLPPVVDRLVVTVKEGGGSQQRSRSLLVDQHGADRNQQRSVHHDTSDRPQRDHRPRDSEDAEMLRGVAATYLEILGQVRILLSVTIGEYQAMPRTEDARAHRRGEAKRQDQRDRKAFVEPAPCCIAERFWPTRPIFGSAGKR
mmetsp:Transcript_18194/g.49156  ORF Transcript_18194/g.49156 Transcript_18194/m.49156 type:complete len:293 (-) Transcript_18194:73-951(-)